MFVVLSLLTFSVTSVSAHQAEYRYDKNGNLSVITQGDTEIAYQADNNGNLTSKSLRERTYKDKLENGDFHEVNNGGKAVGWSYMTDDKAASSFNIQKIGSRNHQQIQASNIPVGDFIGIKQALWITKESSRGFDLKASLKIEHLQNAEVVMMVDFVDNTGKVIGNARQKSTLQRDFFFTMSLRESIPQKAERAIVQIAIHSTGNNAAGTIVIKGVDVSYGLDYYFNLLMNHDFQGREIQVAEGTIPDYWEISGDNGSAKFNLMTTSDYKKRQVISYNSNGTSKESYLIQHLLIDDSRNYQLRGIFNRLGNVNTHFQILFFNEKGTLLGTNYTTSDSITDQTASLRGNIPKGAVYATVYVGARYSGVSNVNININNVYIAQVSIEYSTEPQALWNSLFTLFDQKSDIAQGWAKRSSGAGVGAIYGKSSGDGGQNISVPFGIWGNLSAEIYQDISLEPSSEKGKFALYGEISILSSSNAKLEVEVGPPKRIGSFPQKTYKETYILGNGRQVITIRGDIAPNTREISVSVRLLPIVRNKAWAENVIIHNLRFNPNYNPSGPVEMFLPEEME
ncbi:MULTISPECIES: hypothetical protein [Paenibacillus]|uniref:hypothetical protein n=1 Tax=Paenibacillus TaxID=44249 RepID=UPI000385E708|nr:MULTISPECIES: hypothetical protein [Paenibacillus]EPY14902.1 hypothetical protein PAAL66ix_00245 [Paenibacillus alvei A6-6i-x]SDF47551.1 hypothetical protein SAMN04488689_105107 [Paenibacillus sp. cl6col]